MVTKQRGSSMAEYVIACLFIFGMVFAPAGPGGASVADLLVDALKKNHHGYVWASSIPT